MSKRSRRKETKNRRRERFSSGDCHQHVFLSHPDKPGKIITKTKRDHGNIIGRLLSKGWEIISRPD